MSLFTIEEVFYFLEIEADKEESKVKTDIDSCYATFDVYACTRPKGHKGYHIALGEEEPRIIAMWREGA